jgi:hypothetical protein
MLFYVELVLARDEMLRGIICQFSVNPSLIKIRWWVEIMRVAKNTRRFISICIVIFFALAGAAGCAVTEKTNPAGLNDITGDKAFVEQQESENGTVPAVVDGDNDEAGAGDNQAEGEVPATPTEPKPEPAPAGSTIDPSGLSNAKKGWGLKRNDQHQQPEMPASISAELSKYGAYWIGNPDEKAVYLTFDEGYENGYTGRILDILKANDVKAAFFVTGHYLESQPALVKRMVEEGHIVGNHTDSHPSLPDISDEKIKQELLAVEQAYELFTFMNQRGMYQVPTMQQQTQDNFMNIYQHSGTQGMMPHQANINYTGAQGLI